MKVLLIFPNWLGRSGEYCQAAASKLGWESTLVWGSYHETGNFCSSIYTALRRQPLLGPVLEAFEARLFNDRIKSVVTTLRPDLVLNNCPNLFPETVEVLRQSTNCLVYWAGDDPAIFPSLMRTIHRYNFVFLGAPYWLADHVLPPGPTQNFLPYGCEPSVFYPLPASIAVAKNLVSEIAFVGARYSDREELLASLGNFDLGIWGWKRDNSVKRLYRKMRGERHSLFHEKYGTDGTGYRSELNGKIRGAYISNSAANKIYNAATTVLNLQHPQMRSAVNSKTFEIAAAGGFQLLQHSGELLGLFEKDREMVCFDSREELQDKLRFYLRNQEARQQIAIRARQRVMREHTFRHRLEAIRAVVGG